MFKFLFLYRSPDGEDNGGGASDTADTQDAIEAALRDEGGPADDKGGATDKGGTAGSSGAGAGSSDDKGGAADDKSGADDPEHELGLEDGDKKPIKVKLSELIKNSKWIKENEKALAGFAKLRDEGAKNPDFNKLMRTVISKAYEGDKYNEAFVKSQLTQLEKVAEKVDDKIEAKDEDIDATQTMLDELDADSPQAKVLAHNLKIMKAQKAQLVAQAGQLDTLSKRLDGIDKTVKTGQEKAAKEKDDAEVKRIADVFDQSFETLLSTKTNGYEFEDAEEKDQFEDLVRNGVANRSQTIKTDEDFKKAITEEAKTAMAKINGIREKYTNRYLRSKGKLPAKDAKDSKPKNDKDNKPNLGDLDTEGIASMFENALKEEAGAKK